MKTYSSELNCLRSYHEENISGNDISNGTVDIAYYHFAIVGERLGSCVTFVPPSKVPPGLKYNVSRIISAKYVYCG